ncbi:MAG: hypothetical protein ACJA2B_001000, partial [Candidatus Endobugula sp.]
MIFCFLFAKQSCGLINHWLSPVVEDDEDAQHFGYYIQEKLVSVAPIYTDDTQVRLRKFTTLPRSLSDLGRIYCGSKKSVPFPDHFRRIGSLFASNDRKNALDL